MTRILAHRLVALCVVFGLIGLHLADSYVSRLPNHDGYYLVAVSDQIPADQVRPGIRPRHTVLVVIDGLRADHALKMDSVRRLREAGQCGLMQVGSVSVSRPVYAVLSTGLEQDRTGARNNDETRPLRVESIWQVARQAGLRVTGTSELEWWKQLFPDGFDSYRIVTRAEDHFTTPESELGDLALFHPIYVDENGHDFGGRSPEYAAAAVRADRELGRLLDRLDLKRDLVIFTADHGHTDRGGHGAGGIAVSQVMTCFGGHGIRPKPPLPSERIWEEVSDNRLIAPALAVLLQLRFPTHLRAGEDSLDSIFSLLDPSVFPADYLENRHLAVQRFRQANQAAVAQWMGVQKPANWSDLYGKLRRWQLIRGLLLLGAFVVFVRVVPRRFRPARPLFFVLWCLGTLALCVLLYNAGRGSLDFNSINTRYTFIKWGGAASVLAGLLSIGVHFQYRSSLAELAVDQVRVCLLLLVLSLAHIVAFGWPIGFPVPDPFLFFVPFLLGTFLTLECILGALLCLRLARKIDTHPAPLPDNAHASSVP